MSKTRQMVVLVGVAALVTVGFAWIRWFTLPGPSGPRRIGPLLSLSSGTVQQPRPWKIVDFELTDSQGEAFASTELRGDVWLLSFFSTRNPATFRQQEVLARFYEQFNPRGVKLVSITSDPATDTVPVLKEFADRAGGEPGEWIFLTGDTEQIERIAREFQLNADASQMDWLVVIDRWGWFRALYPWRYSKQLAALRNTLTQLLRETEFPHQAAVAADASGERPEGWIQEFTLTDRTGEPFGSRELAGRVWVASFFFSTCPSVCRTQNTLVASLHEKYGPRGVVFVSITCDPQTDTPERLAEYARLFDADPDQWRFLTGDLESIRRIGAEVFEVPVAERVHVERLLVMDPQGARRGSYDWHDARQLDELRRQLDALLNDVEGGP